MEIKHKLSGAELKYGYIWWHVEEESNYKKIFPSDRPFTIKIYDTKIENRKVDWKRHRIYISGMMKNYFKKGDVIKISRKQKSKIVEISKEK